MEELNTYVDGKSLVFNGWDLNFFCLHFKNPVGTPAILVFFPVRMGFQCSFPIRMKFCFRFCFRFFQWGGGPTGSVTQRCEDLTPLRSL